MINIDSYLAQIASASRPDQARAIHDQALQAIAAYVPQGANEAERSHEMSGKRYMCAEVRNALRNKLNL